MSVIWGTGLPIIYALNVTSMVMVTVGTYIAGKYVFRDGFSGAGWQWGRAKHYLAAIGIPAMMWVVPTLIRVISGTLELSDASRTEVAIWVPILLFVTLIPGFGPMSSLLSWAPSFCGWATRAAWREK